MAEEPGVEFKEIAQIFITTFVRPSFTKVMDQPAQPTTDKDIPTTDKTTGKNISATEKLILGLIDSTPSITQNEMAHKLGMTIDGVRYHTDNLKSKGLLKRIGGKKKGWWEIS
jgi:ATP-dependent DNA helicase RecG